jgi:hypothetical protein
MAAVTRQTVVRVTAPVAMLVIHPRARVLMTVQTCERRIIGTIGMAVLTC